MSTIYIGTSGYSYKDWIGPFYPEGMKEAAFLEYYVERFNSVELNFSYYSMPRASMIRGMVAKTPDRFRFSIKAHKSLTHEIDSDACENSAREFIEGIRPLIESRRLGAVLFQFPFSFHYTPDNREHLSRICGLFEAQPVAIEFRNSEWLKEPVFKGLAERNAGIVCLDEPDLPGLIRPLEIVTAPLAYIRFHGRNAANWWSGTNVTRYDYLYSDDEISQWVPRIEKILETARILIIAFNNHYKGQAVKNAGRLKELLADRGTHDVL